MLPVKLWAGKPIQADTRLRCQDSKVAVNFRWNPYQVLTVFYSRAETGCGIGMEKTWEMNTADHLLDDGMISENQVLIDYRSCLDDSL